MSSTDRYSHGHHESVLRSHRWRTAENSAGFLLGHLRDDQRLLDIGCGPGNITIDLARRLPRGSVLGVDAAEAAIEQAQRAPRDGVENVRFAVGDAYHLELEDDSVDVVYAHQVLQHLTDPVAALVEMRRVLVPGGLLAVRDADYGAFTWTPEDPRLDGWMALYQRLARANRTEPNGGRHLPTWVRRAGFTLESVTGSSWIYWSEAERQWWGQLWADRARYSAFAEQCLADALATPEELEAIAAAFLDWAASADGCFQIPNTEVLARP